MVSLNNIEINRQNAAIVSDDEHSYCIHEKDVDIFYDTLEKCEGMSYGLELDNFTNKFGNNKINGCSETFKKTLK